MAGGEGIMPRSFGSMMGRAPQVPNYPVPSTPYNNGGWCARKMQYEL